MGQNKMMAMFDVNRIKKLSKEVPQDEVLILCGHWSINRPKYDDPEEEDWDWFEFEEEIGECLMVTDYDDLIIDPHGIMI